jgi:hypothetical protein
MALIYAPDGSFARASVDARDRLALARQVHGVRDVRADLRAGDRHAQRLGDLAHADAERLRGFVQRGRDGFSGPRRQLRQALARVGQRRPCGGGEVLGDGGLFVLRERLEPHRGAFGHVLQRLHAITQGDDDVGGLRALGEVVTLVAQVPFEVLATSSGASLFRYCWLSQPSLAESRRDAFGFTSFRSNNAVISAIEKISWSPCDQPRRTR